MAHKIGDLIKEQAITAGTDDFVFSGALADFLPFSSVLTEDGDTTWYNARNGGEFEIGLGTRLSESSMARTRVLKSSNAGAKVYFSAPPVVFCTVPAANANGREILTAARIYYVRTDGSDSNTGLANTAGGAFLTLQKASDVIERTLDLAGQAVTVQVGDGTYTAGVILPNWTGGGSVTFLGNAATPANVLVSATSENCFFGATPRVWHVNGFKTKTTTSGGHLSVSSGAQINFSNIDFGVCAGSHISASTGGRVVALSNFAISGGAQSHVSMSGGAVVREEGRTITITNTPAFSTAFVYARTNSVYEIFSNTFVGSATGSRYNISHNAAIFVNGASITYLPGNAAGFVATGAVYG
jgi:hypothetical protein